MLVLVALVAAAASGQLVRLLVPLLLSRPPKGQTRLFPEAMFVASKVCAVCRWRFSPTVLWVAELHVLWYLLGWGGHLRDRVLDLSMLVGCTLV